ncbi:MAG: Spy/CpxP family protein refolding chaperone, partial [Vulcanimicrobiaceae bacterium]
AAAPAFALGCGGAQANVSQPGATRAPVAPSTSSDIKVFTEALSDVPLTGAQRGEIDHLAADADGRHASIAEARKALELALADQVDAGHVDRGALQPKIDAIVAAVQATQAPDRAAFERLHAILDPDQRVAFVNALEAHIHDRVGEVRHGGPMREWADALKLTDDQQSRIRVMMKDEMEKSHPMKEAMHHAERGAKILGAFKADRFVFDEVAPQQDLHERVTTGVDRFLDLANQVLPLLTPEQRTAASQRLRSKAGSIGFGP